MLRLFLRSPLRLIIWLDRSCPTNPRLLHDTVPGTPKPPASDTTVSYLVDSYGLCPAAALSVAKKFTIKTTGGADFFLSVLRAHGFKQRQIASIVTSCPQLLTYDTKKKIIPKFDFFINVGYSSSELVKIISSTPQILHYSLEKKLSPNFHTLSGILGSDRRVAIATGRSPRILVVSMDRVVLPNMKTLVDIGVPQHNIVKIATYYPRGLIRSHSSFNKMVGWLEKIGFDVSKPEYIMRLHGVSFLSPSTLERKLEFYRSLGWSEESILSAFSLTACLCQKRRS